VAKSGGFLGAVLASRGRAELTSISMAESDELRHVGWHLQSQLCPSVRISSPPSPSLSDFCS
jgi:hypothetical protein